MERLWRSAKPSLLGEGILERARSTTLALLGVTAAVGLAVVALALQQSWPLAEGSPVPEVSAVAVGEGVAVTRKAGGDGSPSSTGAGRRGQGSESPSPGDAPAAAAVPDSSDVTSASPVLAGSGGLPPANPDRDRPSPPPPAPAASPSPSEPAPDADPERAQPQREPPAQPDPPVAVISTHPGNGNAYGKDNGSGPPGGEPPGQAKK